MEAKKIIFQNETEWLNYRKDGLGGTSASAIVGMNPYLTNQDLYDQKVGLAIPEDIGHKEFVIYGKKAEAPLAELFKLDFPEYDLERNDYWVFQSNKYPFLFASIDGLLTCKRTGEQGILEIKTTNILQSMQKEKWNHSIPQSYYCQLLHYLLVTGLSYAILKAQLKYSYDNDIFLSTKHYRIDRANVQADLDYLLEAELKFWEQLQRKERPNLILPAI
jgi:putative phage-type endonuclease